MKAGRRGDGRSVEDGELELDAAAVDPQRPSLWRGPRVGPVRSREREAKLVAALEDPGRRLELERDLSRRVGDEGLRSGVAVSMGEIQNTPAHECRGSVWEDVADPSREERHGMRRRDRQAQTWVSEQVELVLERPLIDE